MTIRDSQGEEGSDVSESGSGSKRGFKILPGKVKPSEKPLSPRDRGDKEKKKKGLLSGAGSLFGLTPRDRGSRKSRRDVAEDVDGSSEPTSPRSQRSGDTSEDFGEASDNPQSLSSQASNATEESETILSVAAESESVRV